MDLDNIRINILNSIIEMYHNSEYYDALSGLLNSGDNLSFLLKKYALTYIFCINNLRLSWTDGKASTLYIDKLAIYQKGYDLYCEYAKYFLGANVLYPTMELVFESNFQNYSLIFDGRIDYSKYVLHSLRS